MTEENSDIELLRHAILSGGMPGRYFNEKGHFQPAKLSIDIRKLYHIVTISDNRDVYIYNEKDGFWRKDTNEEFLRTTTKKILGVQYRESRTKSMIDDITASKQIAREEFGCPEYLVPVKNGIIDTRTNPYKLIPHSHNYYITAVIPSEYKPEVKSPLWEKFLVQILPDVTHRMQLQEWFGSCLTPSRAYMLILILYGGGDNGKSTFLNALITTLGSHNVSKESLGNIAYGKWYVGNLFGKLANIYGDIGLHELKHTGIIKILTGDDWATGEYKFKSPFNFKNNAKPSFGTNKIPIVYDKSDAFYKRVHIIPFRQRFPLGTPENIPEMIKKLITPEGLSTILNWGLEGLARLFEQKSFTELPPIDERRTIWEACSNPLTDFIDDCVGIHAGTSVTKDNFYNAYMNYNIENKKPTMTKEKLGRLLPHIIPTVETFYPSVGEGRKYSWSGIHLKDGDESEKTPKSPTKFNDFFDKMAKEGKSGGSQQDV